MYPLKLMIWVMSWLTTWHQCCTSRLTDAPIRIRSTTFLLDRRSAAFPHLHHFLEPGRLHAPWQMALAARPPSPHFFFSLRCKLLCCELFVLVCVGCESAWLRSVCRRRFVAERHGAADGGWWKCDKHHMSDGALITSPLISRRCKLSTVSKSSAAVLFICCFACLLPSTTNLLVPSAPQRSLPSHNECDLCKVTHTFLMKHCSWSYKTSCSLLLCSVAAWTHFCAKSNFSVLLKSWISHIDLMIVSFAMLNNSA